MKPRVPEHLRGLQPYRPGKPIEEVERELGLGDAIKLASNENALGPSPAAIAALGKTLAGIHRYPDGSGITLRTKIAERIGVTAGEIILGNGSNELIDLLVRVFVAPGDEVVFSKDAFLIYDIVTRASRGVSVAVPASDFRHDLTAIADAISERTKVVFLANPNNPTGTTFGRDAWGVFLSSVPSRVVIAVDQAYREYVDDPSYADVLEDVGLHPGLVVIRTFSKIYGLAGLRIGYAVASAELVDAMMRVRAPFSVNRLAQIAAAAALDDLDHVERSRELVRKGRATFARGLERLGLAYVPSQANFVLIDVGDGERVTAELLQCGIIVRPMKAYRLPSMIRVTFGTDEENARCLDALAQVLGDGDR